MTMITPSYLGETIEYSSLHACRSTLEDPTDLLDIKKTIGLPDARFDASGMKECQLSDLETNTSIALLPCARDGVNVGTADAPEIERLVKTVTDAVMAAIAGK